MLGFLGQDGAEKGHIAHLDTAVGGEDHLDGGNGAESDVGEGFGEQDGAGEVGDWEAVLAGSDGGLACGVKESVCSDGVDLFLLEFGLAGEG